MIILGIICLVVGYLVGLPLLYTIGIILIVLGIIFEVLGRTGHPVGRRHWY